MPYLHPNNPQVLFQLALGVAHPWKVGSIVFAKGEERLDIHVACDRKTTFPCMRCSNQLSLYDTVQRTWRHLNFFQYETYIHAEVPRIHCDDCGTTKTVVAPWARHNSGFTLLFEAFIMELSTHMPLSVVGSMVKEHDTRLMRIVRYYVQQARSAVDMSTVRIVSVDETSKAKGYEYITPFIDQEQSRVLYVTEGKDSTTIERFTEDLQEHGGKTENITQVCADLSPAYQKGVREHLPHTAKGV